MSEAGSDTVTVEYFFYAEGRTTGYPVYIALRLWVDGLSTQPSGTMDEIVAMCIQHHKEMSSGGAAD